VTSSPTLCTGKHSVVKVTLSTATSNLTSTQRACMLPVLTVCFCVSCRLGYSCDSLHGDKTQQMRDRAMERYRNGQLRVLIATDVASRGLDVKVMSVALM
jgi:late competence protein required for DNA uptake (superfamily II DNA/RNA helicase)